MTSPAKVRLPIWRIVGLMMLVAAHVGLTAVCWARPNLDWQDWIEVAIEFLLLTQVVLLALWVAWSDLTVLWRWMIATAICLVMYLVVGRYGAWASPRGVDTFSEISPMCAIVLLAAHAMLLPLRWLGGWRLTFYDGPPLSGRRGQFTLQHWFVWCACLVLPIALFSVYPRGDTASGVLIVGSLILFVSPLLAAALLAAFSRRWWLWSPIAVGWTCPVGLAIVEIYWQYLLARGGGFPGRHAMLLLIWVGAPAAVTAGLLVNLLILRALGMRWVRVGDSTAITNLPVAAKTN